MKFLMLIREGDDTIFSIDFFVAFKRAMTMLKGFKR